MLVPHVHPQFLIACALVAHGWRCVWLSFEDKMCIVHLLRLAASTPVCAAVRMQRGWWVGWEDTQHDGRVEKLCLSTIFIQFYQ